MRTPRLAALMAAMTAAGRPGRLQRRHQRRLAAAASSTSNVLTLASVDQGSIEDVVKAFEAANPGVKVSFTTSGADQYQQQIRTQLASGTAPDVMSVWPGNGNPGATYVLAKPGYLLDLSDQPWAAKLPAGDQERRPVRGQDLQRGLRAQRHRRGLQPAGHGQGRAHPAGHLDRAARPSAGPPRPRERRRSPWATRTTG